MKTQKCRVCGIEHPATREYFKRMSACRTGLKSKCKICDGTFGKQYFRQKEYGQSEIIFDKALGKFVKAKTCKKCGKLLALNYDNWGLDNNRWDKYTYYCRACNNAKNPTEQPPNNILTLKKGAN